MSEIAEVAQSSIMMCDFANADSAGKLNIIGGGVTVVGYDPLQGITTRFVVVVRVSIPSELTPLDVPVELALRDAADDVVSLGSPPQAIRMAQITKFERPNVPGFPTLPPALASHSQMVVDFQGLPLTPGAVYSWVVRIDGDEDRVQRYNFVVLGGPPQVVMH